MSVIIFYHQSTNVGPRMSFRVCVFLWQEKQKKLWHAPYYDSEMKLKQQYIKICKNLPAFGCKLYQVKELLRGNAQKKVRWPKNVLNELKVVHKFCQVRELLGGNQCSGKSKSISD